MKNHKKKLSEEINAVIQVLAENHLSLGEILAVFGLRGLALVSIVFCLPFLLPIPIPGLSSALCWVIIFCGFGIAIGKIPWLPQKLTKKKVKIDAVILERMRGIVQKFEFLFKPRFYPNHFIVNRLVGVFVILAAILLGLPLPPGGNFLPAIAIILVCLGYLEGDGLAALLGITVLAVFFCLLVFMFGWVSKAFQIQWIP